MIVIRSLQIGTVVTEGDSEIKDVTRRRWTSGFRKTPRHGPVHVGSQGIDGDQVADRKHHGGPDKALLCYAAAHYALWSREHPELNFAPGGFGENLTLEGVREEDVCLGDRWQSRACEFQISQPRQPCWKIARRWQTKSMTKEVAQTGRTGWYLRVIRGGTLTAGETMTLVERPQPEWSVARANDVLFGRDADPASASALLGLPELSGEWKAALG